LSISTREEEIIKYIIDNEGCTKTEVTYHMERTKGPVFASHETTSNIIKTLEKDGKIIVRPDKSNSQKHLLYINRKNEFNILNSKITELETLSNKLSKIISYRLKVKKLKRSQRSILDSISKEYFELIHLAQLTIYTEITSTANRIENSIKSREDQETLYLQLTQTLNTSNKLNEMLTPEIYKQVQKFANKMNNKRDPTKVLIISNLIKEVSDLFVKR
jgi:hypothetical protein